MLRGGVDVIVRTLLPLTDSTPVVVDAVHEDDMRLLALGLAAAEEQGKRFLFRVGPPFVRARIGQEVHPHLTAQDVFGPDGSDAVGGLIVAVVHPRAALVINAATFAVSALIIALALGRTGKCAALEHRAQEVPAPAAGRTAAPSLWREPLRPLVLLVALAGFFVVPEGLAVPVAHDLGASSRVAGLLLAAGPLGSAVGATLLVRFHVIPSAPRVAAPSRSRRTAMSWSPPPHSEPWPIMPRWIATVARLPTIGRFPIARS